MHGGASEPHIEKNNSKSGKYNPGATREQPGSGIRAIHNKQYDKAHKSREQAGSKSGAPGISRKPKFLFLAENTS
jgi:hypothetical protein